jgi:toxin YoeB
MRTILFASSARKDAKKITKSGLKNNAENLLLLLSQDPFIEPPPFKSLQGDLSGACSRRLDYQHRIVSEVFEESKAVRVLRMWSHYE